jgi:DNA-binding CsgD family transcriptional regulator
MSERDLAPSVSVVPRLTTWGLSADADLVFRVLSERGPQTAAQLGASLGLTRLRVADALDELTASDACRSDPTIRSGRPWSETRLWHGRSPTHVLAGLHRRHVEAASATRGRRTFAKLAELGVELTDASVRARTVRVLGGTTRVRMRLAELVAETRREHLSMHPEPIFEVDTVRAAAPLDHTLVRQGRTVLTLGVPATVGDTTAAHTSQLTAGGMEHRELPSLPIKLIIVDRRVAVLPLDPHDIGQGALEVYDPPAVEELVARFLSLWASAGTSKNGPTMSIELTPRERAIVNLLAGGHTDSSASASLGLSRRTVVYAIQGLMERCGVQNRFQLGLVLGPLRNNPTGADDESEYGSTRHKGETSGQP